MAELSYQRLFESLKGKMVVLSTDCRIVAATEEYLSAAMVKREQVLGRNVFEAFPANPDDPLSQGNPALRDSLNRVLATGRPDAMALLHYDIRRPESLGGGFEERWWKPQNTPILDAAGRVEFILHEVEDVTEHVRLTALEAEALKERRLAAERALAGGGEMGALMRAQDWSRTPVGPVVAWPQSLKTAVSIMLENKFGMCIAWGPRHLQFYNDAFRPILGSIKHPTALGSPIEKTFAEAWSVMGPFFDSALGGNSVASEDWHLRLDRHGYLEDCFFTFSYSPIRDETGGVGGVLITVTETTARVRSERESEKSRLQAEASEAQLRLIADRLPALISYMDTSGRYRFVNQAYCKWFGKPRSEIEGKTRRQLVNNEATYGFMQPYEVKAMGGEAVSFELRLTKATGEWVDLDAEYLPDRSPEDGRVLGIVGVGHDITVRKKALADLEAAVGVRDEFMSIASHELKTPITSLKLQLQLAQRRLPADPPQQLVAAFATSLRQVERLRELVESLLDVARIQAGRIEYTASAFDAAELVTDVLERFRGQLEEAHCELEVALPSALNVVWDRFRIEQVLVNLISNAIKYAAGSKIRVALEGMSANGDFVGEVGPRGSQVLIRVKDTGPGIALDRQEKIFERFERATPSANISGLGLGLFIARQIVQGHNGTIEVRSAPGAGTEFVVSLPSHRG